jgi:hypothetical protein
MMNNVHWRGGFLLTLQHSNIPTFRLVVIGITQTQEIER